MKLCSKDICNPTKNKVTTSTAGVWSIFLLVMTTNVYWCWNLKTESIFLLWNKCQPIYNIAIKTKQKLVHFTHVYHFSSRYGVNRDIKPEFKWFDCSSSSRGLAAHGWLDCSVANVNWSGQECSPSARGLSFYLYASELTLFPVDPIICMVNVWLCLQWRNSADISLVQ